MNPIAAASPVRPSFLRFLRFLRTSRFWIYLLVTAAWCGMLAQLWSRELGQDGLSLKRIGISPEVLLVAWTDYDQWLWIEREGQHIGVTRLKIPTARDDAPGPDGANPGSAQYLMQARTWIKLPVMGLEIPADLNYEVALNPAFEMESMRGHLLVAGYQFLIQAFVEDRYLYYRVKAASGATSSSGGGALLSAGALQGLLGRLQQADLCGRSPLTEPLFLTDAVIPVLTRSANIKVGENWVTRAANPLSGVGHTDVRIAVEAKETLTLGEETVEAWRISQQIGQIRSTGWYNNQGVMVQGEMEPGLRLKQAKASQACQEYPELRRDYRFTAPLDRNWIRQHLDPKLDGKPLSQLLPSVPGLL